MMGLASDRLAALAVLAALVAACGSHAPAAAGPIEAYEPSPEDRFRAEMQGAAVEEPWWTLFGSRELEELVQQALAGNGDLAAAWGRVEQAEARTVQALSPVLPSLSVDVAESTSPYDALGFQFGGLPSAPGDDGSDDPDVVYSGSAMLDVKVPLSLWNGTLSSARAGHLDAVASEGDGEAAALTVASRVAGAYFDVLAAREQVGIVQEQIEAHEALLELTEARFGVTDASALDVLQQRQALASTRALLPQARATLRAQEGQLAVLLGRGDPVAIVGMELPELPPPPDTGRPVDLLHNRPDLRASAARLEAARSRTLAAAGGLAPSLSLSGSVGTQFIYIDEMDTLETWGMGASLSIPLFAGARGWASLVEARAGQRVAADTHGQAVLAAVEQVRGAVVREQEITAQLDAVRAQLDAARLSFQEARRHYESGLTGYLTVLTALTSLQQAQLSRLSAERSLLDARVQLYESLGGAWTDALSAHHGDR